MLFRSNTFSHSSSGTTTNPPIQEFTVNAGDRINKIKLTDRTGTDWSNREIVKVMLTVDNTIINEWDIDDMVSKNQLTRGSEWTLETNPGLPEDLSLVTDVSNAPDLDDCFFIRFNHKYLYCFDSYNQDQQSTQGHTRYGDGDGPPHLYYNRKSSDDEVANTSVDQKNWSYVKYLDKSIYNNLDMIRRKKEIGRAHV